MKIEVTQTDIERGLRENPLLCPVALALHRTTGAQYLVATYTYEKCGVGRVHQLPHAVSGWIRQYDAKQWPVEPFSFEIDDTI